MIKHGNELRNFTHTLLLLTIHIYIEPISARKEQVLVEAGGDNRYSSQTVCNKLQINR